MKKKFLLFSAVAGIASMVFSSYTNGPASGGAGNHTGSAGSSANCSGGGCHTSNTTATTGVVFISEPSSTTPVTAYVPGHTYQLNIGATNTSTALSRFGYQVSSVKTAATSTQAGTLTAGTGSHATTISGTLKVLEHSSPLAALSTGVYGTTGTWVAPAAGTGSVTFFAMVNVVNFNGSESGDAPNATTATITEKPTSVGSIENTLSLTAFPNPATNVLNVKIAGGKASQYKVAIYDMLGRTMQQQTINAQEATINTSALATGHYVAVVTSEAGRGVVSFAKQ